MRISTNPGRTGAGSFVFRRTGRLAAALAFLAGTGVPAVVLHAAPACAAEMSGGRAGIVIKYSETSEVSRCVSLFSAMSETPMSSPASGPASEKPATDSTYEPMSGSTANPASPEPSASASEGMSGIQALKSLGDIKVVTKDYGGDLGEAVCKIGDVGTDDCAFDKGFWAYYHASAAGGWQEAQEGASSYRLVDGAVDGWSWTPAGATQTPPKPALFDEVCAKAQAETAAADDSEEKPSSTTGWVLTGAAILVLVIAAILIGRRRGGTV